jgi:hypothetical protein
MATERTGERGKDRVRTADSTRSIILERKKGETKSEVNIIAANANTKDAAIDIPQWPPTRVLIRHEPALREGHDQKATYSNGDSPVVTRLSTSPSVRSLNRREQTGPLVFYVIWPYVIE